MAGQRIVIVEDQSIVAKDLRNTLTHLGYDVQAVASTGEDAVRLVDELHPDLVLMDIVLDGKVDGVEAADVIRHRYGIPIIYLTAHADLETIERAKRTVPEGYLVKPFRDGDIGTTIEVALYRHRMEQRVHASEQRLASILRSIDNGVIATDKWGRVLFMNSPAEALTGWSLSEATGRMVTDVLEIRHTEGGGEAPQTIDEFVRCCSKTGPAGTLFLNTRSGDRLEIDCTATPTSLGDGGQDFVIAFRDVTEKKNLEREQKRILQTLSDVNRQLTGLNRITGGIIGTLDLKTLYKSILTSLVEVMHPDYAVVWLLENGELVVSAGIDEHEPGGIGYRTRADEGFAGAIAQEGRSKAVEDISGGIPLSNPFLEKSGIRSIIGAPMIHDGKIIGVVAVCWKERHTIANQEVRLLEVAAERGSPCIVSAQLYRRTRELQEELERRVQERTAELEFANKELEAFSYSVSHDLRAPLRAINGFSGALMEDYASKLDLQGRNYLEIILTNTRTMAQLIDDLLQFSRLGRKEVVKSVVDMNEIANDVVREVRRAYPMETVEVNISELPRAFCDAAMIRQVFVNLIGNAFKFSRDSSSPTVEIFSIEDERGVIYAVRDNGVGFDMKYRDKLFGVFQRLHSAEEFEGSGVGLAIVQRIIRAHGGRIWAEGKVGAGATFYFSVSPLTEADRSSPGPSIT